MSIPIPVNTHGRNEVRLSGIVIKDYEPQSIIISNEQYETASVLVTLKNGKEIHVPILIKANTDIDWRRALITGTMYSYYVKYEKEEGSQYKQRNHVFVSKIENPLSEAINYVKLVGKIQNFPIYNSMARGGTTNFKVKVPNAEGILSSISCIAYGYLASEISRYRGETTIALEGKIQGKGKYTKVRVCNILK